MQYFDKAFFRFTFGFLLIICASLLVMYLASSLGGDSETQIAKPISAPPR